MFKKSLLISLTLLTISLHAEEGRYQQKPKETSPAAKPAAPQAAPASSKIVWMTNFEQAAQKAKSENKPLLLFFTGSDWCGWCKKLESEVFESKEFASAVGNKFIFVDVDFPMNKQLPADLAQQNAALKKKFGITGYPTIVILDPNQNFIAETGYRPGGGKAYADYLMSLLQ